jgi:hypothetical protein
MQACCAPYFPLHTDRLLNERCSRQSVLESVGGDQDSAVDTLLGMSDPEHVSTAIPEQTQARPLSQILDGFAPRSRHSNTFAP